jgi:hypothetical protein
MLPKDKKLLRLVSARFDISKSFEAYEFLRSVEPDSPLFYHLAVSMSVSYGRPFTANHGLGSLAVEYPKFPDFEDSEMNERHLRLIDLRNKFMAHSSCEGTKVLILPPDDTSNQSGHMVGKRFFGDIRFYDWLKDVIVALRKRLDIDCKAQAAAVGANLKTSEEMETGYDDFSWSTKGSADAKAARTLTSFMEEAISLTSEQRRQLTNLLLDSLRDNEASVEETKKMLRARIDALRSGRDSGAEFKDVFGHSPN